MASGDGRFRRTPGPLLNALNLPHRPVQGRGHLLVHLGGSSSTKRGPTAALKSSTSDVMRENRWGGNLVAVEVEMGTPPVDGVEELVECQAGQRAGLRLPVTTTQAAIGSG